jgi:hypothetical protein
MASNQPDVAAMIWSSSSPCDGWVWPITIISDTSVQENFDKRDNL